MAKKPYLNGKNGKTLWNISVIILCVDELGSLLVHKSFIKMS
jgi:hypothetical protein